MSDEISSKRTRIPADVRRRVLIEAGHRCAIPACRETEIDVHHITPWEECKENAFDNLIALCPTCHRRAHKGEIDRKALRLYKNDLLKNSEPDAPICDHGIVTTGRVVLRRSDGKIHRLTVAGDITITTAGWTQVAETLILKITNGGSYATTWEGFNSLPFTNGFVFSANDTDILKIIQYDGDVFFEPFHIAIKEKEQCRDDDAT